ncbi:MAG: hypothetical protein A3F13_02700 [Gammaproteobacteria bacterium RIFCSPHIGHO2_12_FULL_40_19]|nr:MAG: hypothetical protein A3F13_02700 [Gammaproteobacteria bacterium RIFCSPHIGHO2_12_FULL_40_19]
MICPKCNKEFREKDFLGKEKCFKCTYAEKLRVLPILKMRCRVCGNDVPKGRTKYCSGVCSDHADERRSQEYWFRNMHTLQVNWR